jgi:DNA polymerase-3 subunit delta'
MSSVADFLSDANNARAWAEFRSMLDAGGAPGALLAVVDAEEAPAFRDLYARAALCHSGCGDDGCSSCAAWREDGHPDMVTAGDGAGPPGVADCLEAQAIMGLRPFVAKGRLCVIPFADALSLPAANSLLKTAEEPPAGGCLLFLAEEDNLIPTIKSRAWTVRFRGAPRDEASPPPGSPPEWVAWIERTRKASLDDLAAETDAWARHLARAGAWREAASLRNAIYISKKRHIPVSMVQDAMFAILREGVPIGQIFGDIR